MMAQHSSTHNFFEMIYDMTIEQTYMRSIHSTSGLTHGSGVDDASTARWIKSIPM